jgi:hypothetical protein
LRANAASSLRGLAPLAPLVGLAMVLACIAVDARARRTASLLPPASSTQTALPGPNLALHFGARWLRFPSMEEPNAALHDWPSAHDGAAGSERLTRP